MGSLRIQHIEADRARFRALGPHPMPDRLLGILGHQNFELPLRPFVFEKGPGCCGRVPRTRPRNWRRSVNMSPKPLTSSQIRAARALLRWRAEDLAQASAVGIATIRRAELTVETTSLTAANDLSLRRALETGG